MLDSFSFLLGGALIFFTPPFFLNGGALWNYHSEILK